MGVPQLVRADEGVDPLGGQGSGFCLRENHELMGTVRPVLFPRHAISFAELVQYPVLRASRGQGAGRR